MEFEEIDQRLGDLSRAAEGFGRNLCLSFGNPPSMPRVVITYLSPTPGHFYELEDLIENFFYSMSELELWQFAKQRLLLDKGDSLQNLIAKSTRPKATNLDLLVSDLPTSIRIAPCEENFWKVEDLFFRDDKKEDQ